MAQNPMYDAPASSTLVTITMDISAADTTIPVDSTAALPDGPNVISIGINSSSTVEVVKYTSKDASSLIGCERGFSGTVAKDWIAGTAAARAFTSYDHNTFKGNIQDIVSDYVRQPGFAVTSGSANSYAISLNPAPASISNGFGINILIHETNTAESTVSINGGASTPLKKQDGTEYAAGELVANQLYSFRFYGTSFLAVNARKEGSGGGGSEVNGQEEITVEYGEAIAVGDPVILRAAYDVVVYGMNFNSTTAWSTSADISPDGNYFAIGHNTGPWVSVYRKNTDGSFTSLDVSSMGISSAVNSVALCNTHLIVNTSTSPYTRVCRIDGNTLTYLNGAFTFNAAAKLQFSPDGLWVSGISGFNSSTSSYLWTRSDDTFTMRYSNLPNYGGGAAFSADSTLFYLSSLNYRISIYQLNYAAGTATVLTNQNVGTGSNQSMAVTPNERYLVFHSGSSTNGIVALKKLSNTSFEILPVEGFAPIIPTAQSINYALSASADSSFIYFCGVFANNQGPSLRIYYIDDAGLVQISALPFYRIPNYETRVAIESSDGKYFIIGGRNSPINGSNFYIYSRKIKAFKGTLGVGNHGYQYKGYGYALEAGVAGDTKKVMQIIH